MSWRRQKTNQNDPIECGCGEMLLQPGTSSILGKIEHRTDGPCYYIEPEEVDTPPGKGKAMIFNTYVRKPFTVEAVEITAENIAEIAKYVGDLREKEDGSPYILVEPRLVPNIEKVYPGFFMTRMGDNVRCYSRRIFRDQFTQQTPELKPYIDHMVNGDPLPQAS